MWGYIAIFFAFIVFWYFFKSLRDKKSPSPKPLSLSTKPEVGNADSTKSILNNTNTGTIQGFIYPLQAQKSGVLTLCNPTGSENPGEPECSTGQYNLCKCVANDCSLCAHSGYVTVLNISNVIRLEILASPDASRREAASAQLVVRTFGMAFPVVNGKSDTSKAKQQTVFEETIALPHIPFQKWTFVSIAREGRRFDIYYNGNIVASKRTQYLVDIRSAVSAIIAGDPNLTGQIVYVETVPEKLTQTQIMEKYKAQSDTTGRPLIADTMDIASLMPFCKGGDCIKGPAMRPQSPLLDWDTEFA